MNKEAIEAAVAENAGCFVLDGHSPEDMARIARRYAMDGLARCSSPRSLSEHVKRRLAGLKRDRMLSRKNPNGQRNATP